VNRHKCQEQKKSGRKCQWVHRRSCSSRGFSSNNLRRRRFWLDGSGSSTQGSSGGRDIVRRWTGVGLARSFKVLWAGAGTTNEVSSHRAGRKPDVGSIKVRIGKAHVEEIVVALEDLQPGQVEKVQETSLDSMAISRDLNHDFQLEVQRRVGVEQGL
jgi:hypothetical protein